ncbi:hypothetical protein HN865_05415 [Candidatus Woesearchaeota archaeon]|jgi:hypothetical protein|nr:hypothetical protein [Candidatus Woesearchaeota archaeon]
MVKKKGLGSKARSGLVFAGIVSLILGWALWNALLNLEQLFALLLFIAGFSKIFWGIFAK